MSTKEDDGNMAKPDTSDNTGGGGSTTVARKIANSGSGSGAFHHYQKKRRIEIDRIAAMEKTNELEQEREEWKKQIDMNEAEAKERTERNRARRKRRGPGNGIDRTPKNEEPPSLTQEEEDALLKETEQLKAELANVVSGSSKEKT